MLLTGALIWGLGGYWQELQFMLQLPQQMTDIDNHYLDLLVNRHLQHTHQQLLMTATLCVLAAIPSLYWLYRSHARVQGLPPTPAFSPAAAVGWYFVPVMNLITPLEAMQELVQRSQSGTALKPSFLVGLWWLLWIFSQICYGYTLAQNPLIDDAEDMVLLDIMFMGCHCLLIFLCISFIALVSQIYRMQQHSAQLFQASP